MKKTLLCLMALIFCLPMFATLNGNGYYRVQNFRSERYAYLTDNTGHMNQSATTFDVGAILLFSGFDRAACDPATIIYVNNVEGKQYALEAQGTSTTDFVEVALYIEPAPSNRDTYACYGIKGGMRKYLADSTYPGPEQGEATVEGSGDEREWYFHPVGTNDDNYFGVAPSVTAGGKYYYPLYADFPMTPFSEGVKFYTISRIEGQFAILKQITGTLPKAVPVLVECNSPLSINNKVTVGGTGESVGDNLLRGVYFDNSLSTHYNRTPYNASTMRLLGTDAQGNLAFVTGTIDFLPANQSYLTVPDGSAATLRIVTEEEYNELRYLPTSISLSHSEAVRNVGETMQMEAYVHPNDAQTTLTWTSSDSQVATVDNTGKVSCLFPGNTVITATTHNGLSASASLTVYPVPTEVVMSQTEITVTEGDTFTLSAQVMPENVQNPSLRWLSYNENVATVDQNGVVTTLIPGNAIIVAKSWNGITGECQVTVQKRIIPVESVTLSSTSLELEEGQSAQLTATVLPENATDKSVVWSSSNSAIASVSAEGRVTAISEGVASITATSGNVSASCTVTVSAPEIPVVWPDGISLNVSSLALSRGETYTLTATVTPANADDKSVSWRSSDASVAHVNAQGVVTALGKGVATITAKTVNNLTAEVEVTVQVPLAGIQLSPTQYEGTEGTEFDLTLTATPADADLADATWSSSNTGVVTVDNNGHCVIVAEGTAVITASVGSFTAACTVTGTSGVAQLFSGEQNVDVYTVGGVLLYKDADAETLESLHAGIYIIGGRKVIIR